MIEIQKLTKEYRDLIAVDDISFQVQRGDILGFLGRNGAGKTTTMRMITGYLSPTRGSVLIDGHNVFDDPLLVKKQTGYLPETPPLYLDMTAKHYLDHVANLKGLPHRIINKEIDRVTGLCGIRDVQDRLLRNLSKGYKQRVGLAQSLLGDPKVLILDEPTVGLDPAQIREVRSLIKQLAQKHTVILSTHILSEVTMICNRVIIIHKGRIVANDSIENLSRSKDGTLLRIRLAKPNDNAHKLLSSSQGVQHVSEVSSKEIFHVTLSDTSGLRHASLLKSLVDADCQVLEFQNVSPTLEDIFLRIISDDLPTPQDPSSLEDTDTDAHVDADTADIAVAADITVAAAVADAAQTPVPSIEESTSPQKNTDTTDADTTDTTDTKRRATKTSGTSKKTASQNAPTDSSTDALDDSSADTQDQPAAPTKKKTKRKK